MTRARAAGAVALVLTALYLVLLGGGEVGRCLGPLGVTAVECASRSGRIPSEGLGLAPSVLLVLLAVCVALGLFAGWATTMAGAAAGGVAGVLVHLAIRPTAMEGLTSSGEWVSLVRPIDGEALFGATLAGAIVGILAAEVAGSALARRRLRRAAQSADGWPHGRGRRCPRV